MNFRGRVILSAAGFALALCLLSVVRCDASEAENITADCTVSLPSGDGASLLTDGDYTTKVEFSQGGNIEITSARNVSALYVIWDRLPGEWTLEYGDKSLKCGLNGYLHEVTVLQNGAADITLRLPADGAVVCDIYLFGEGELPAFVQRWQPPYSEADILVLSTHADDEHVMFGGVIPYYAGERGLKVQVAYLTNHWGQPVRPHELLNGLWAVGERAYPEVSDFPDLYTTSYEHALTLYDYGEVLEYQVELLRRFKPKVVVGHDLNGEYGHGAHMLNARSLVEALELSADPEAFPESAERYGVWDVPKTYLHLYDTGGENGAFMAWDEPLKAFGGKTAYDMALIGFSYHLSQHEWVSMEQAGVMDTRQYGLYRSTVGPDTVGGDFMENIDFEDYLPPEPEPELEPKPEPEPEPEQEKINPWIFLCAAAVLIVVGTAVYAVWRKHEKSKTKKNIA